MAKNWHHIFPNTMYVYYNIPQVSLFLQAIVVLNINEKVFVTNLNVECF